MKPDVVEDDGAGSDGCPLSYPDSGDYGRSGSYPGAFADVDVPAECGVGSTLWPVWMVRPTASLFINSTDSWACFLLLTGRLVTVLRLGM